MGNCLVTKLKGVVDNNELVQLGHFKIDFPADAYGEGSSDKYVLITGTGPIKIIGATFTDGTTQKTDNAYPSQFPDNVPFTLDYGLKYSVNWIWTDRNPNIRIDIDDICYSEALYMVYSNRLYGDISKIKSTHLEQFGARFVEGDIVNFVNMTKNSNKQNDTINIQLWGADGITGSLKNFCDTFVGILPNNTTLYNFILYGTSVDGSGLPGINIGSDIPIYVKFNGDGTYKVTQS